MKISHWKNVKGCTSNEKIIGLIASNNTDDKLYLEQLRVF